jgi:membrane-bound lytic murein transglycosylase A
VPASARPTLLDDSGDWEGLRQAIARSEAWYARQPRERSLDFGARTVTAGQMGDALRRLREYLQTNPPPQQLARWMEREFEVVESVGGPDGSVLVTGYYEPLIPGSLTRSAEYPVPVYGLPPDLTKPYFTRQQITGEQRLEGRGLEIAWVRDPVDLFFVEVQGSGAIQLAEGGEVRIGYAGSNGHPYRSIGRLLVDEGKVPAEKISMQSIRAYLAEHPEETSRVLNHNESFVFFRRLEGAPEGSLGEPVTPGRSIATDHRVFPPGALAFLETTRPGVGAGGETVAAGPLTRFVLNQDTGGAIRGPGRVDFFWGRGTEAATAAGLMRQPGRLFFLVPRR